MDTSKLAHPKPEKRSTTSTRKARTEAAVVKDVRAACVERDGYCLIMRVAATDLALTLALKTANIQCGGPSEWGHIPPMTRAHTRGLPIEERHSTSFTAIFCRTHHDHVDGRRKPQLLITPTTPAGADGPVRVEVKK